MFEDDGISGDEVENNARTDTWVEKRVRKVGIIIAMELNVDKMRTPQDIAFANILTNSPKDFI